VQQARVDAAFLSLCSAVSTDTVAAIRLEALLCLAGAPHPQQVPACAASVLHCWVCLGCTCWGRHSAAASTPSSAEVRKCLTYA
jgi:hypothetical protein